MFDPVVQWEAPKTDFYWIYNFISVVHTRRLVESHLGFQEESFVADNDHEGFHFFLDRTEIESLQMMSFSFFLNNERRSALWRSIRDIAESIEAMPWELPAGLGLAELTTYLLELESKFQDCAALHLCTQPHLLAPLEDAYRLGIADLPNVDMETASMFVLPTELPVALREQRAWYGLVVQAVASPELVDGLLERHLEDWGLSTAGDGGLPMSLVYLESRLEQDCGDIDAIGRALSNLDLHADPTREQRVEEEANLHLTGELQLYARILREAGHLRFLTRESWMHLWYLLELARARLEDLTGRSGDHATTAELLNAQASCLRSERNTYLLHADMGWQAFYWNGRDERARAELVRDVPWDSWTGVRGETGYHGQVRGTALVVEWGTDPLTLVDSVRRDTILIAPQTTPNFVGLLSQCRGIVTEEGGIAGHASIISRELCIPSVVGARYATRVFSTGDPVLLDANTGSVSHLPRETE